MNKIRKIIISYWFPELADNPSGKVYELEEEIKSVITPPIMYHEDNNHKKLLMPRIKGMSSDKKYFFSLSLINAILSINVDDDVDIDKAILLINNNIQLFYDILKKIYDIKFIYSSIKIEMIDEDKSAKDVMVKNLGLSDNNYENFSIKKGFIKDNYYVNYSIDYSTEYDFKFDNAEKILKEDLFNKSLITSLSDAKINRKYTLTVIEINDRYSYNLDSKYESKKDAIRGMIIELKKILNERLYEKI